MVSPPFAVSSFRFFPRTGSGVDTRREKDYLMMLQVPFCISPHVPYFISRVFQFLLYKLELLLYSEAYHTVQTSPDLGFTPRS